MVTEITLHNFFFFRENFPSQRMTRGLIVRKMVMQVFCVNIMQLLVSIGDHKLHKELQNKMVSK